MLVRLDISRARVRHCVKPQVCLMMLCVAYFHSLHWAQLFVRNNPSTHTPPPTLKTQRAKIFVAKKIMKYLE